MPIIEFYDKDLVCRKSDSGFLIHKVGTDEYYNEAWDLQTSTYIYEETDIPVDQDENGEENEYAEAGRIMLEGE